MEGPQRECTVRGRGTGSWRKVLRSLCQNDLVCPHDLRYAIQCIFAADEAVWCCF